MAADVAAIVDEQGFFKLTYEGGCMFLVPREPKDNPFGALRWELRHDTNGFSVELDENAFDEIVEAEYSDFDDGDGWGSRAAVDEVVDRAWDAARQLATMLNRHGQ